MLHRALRILGLLALLGLLVPPPSARSQPRDAGFHWNQDYDPYVAAIGLAAGMSCGTGLAVRWPALPQTMMGLAGGAWGSENDLAWNVGIEASVVLRQVGRTRFYAGPSFALYSDDKDDDTNANFALGVGLEYLLRSRVALKVDVGFTYLGDDGDVFPLPQIGLFYYF